MIMVFSPAGVRSEPSGALVYETSEDVDLLTRTAGKAYREHGVGGGKKVDEVVVVVFDTSTSMNDKFKSG